MAEGQDLKGRVRTGTQPAADAAPDLLLQIRARGWWLPLRHASVCCGLGRWSEGPSGVAGAGVGRGWGRLGKRCGDEPCYFEGSGAPPLASLGLRGHCSHPAPAAAHCQRSCIYDSDLDYRHVPTHVSAHGCMGARAFK